MFQNFFAFLQAMVTTEARAVRYGIIFMAISTTLVSALQLVLDGGDVILVLCIVVIALNAWWIFSPRRIAAVFGLGEIAELMRLFPRRDGFPPNEPGAIYWRTIKNVFYFLVAYLLLLPFIPLVNWRPSFILLPAMLILIGIFFGSSGTAGIRVIGRLAVLGICFFALCNIFPQIGYYTGLYSAAGKVVTSKAAKLSNDVEQLRASQRAKMTETAQQAKLSWQINNPGKDLPVGHDLLLDVEAAQQGLTLNEYKAKLKAEANAKARADADAKKAMDEAQTEAEKEAKEKALAEIKAKTEAQVKAEADAKARADAEKNVLKQNFSTNQQPVKIQPNSLVTIFPATIKIVGGKQYFECFEVLTGRYRISPADTEVNLGEGWKLRNGGKFEITNSRQTVGVLSPTGNINITIYKEG